MDRKGKASRHHRSKHVTVCDASSTTPKAVLQTNPTPTARTNETQPPATNYFKREASKNYFLQNLYQDGSFYLTAKAVLNDATKKDNLDARDVVMFMSVAHLVSTITRTQRELFATVLNETTKCALREDPNMRYGPKPPKRAKLSTKEASGNTNQEHNSTKQTEVIKLSVPCTKEAIRKQICIGKNSLFTNLPHPLVHKKDDHAYVLPSECIADLMAHGRIDYNPSVSNSIQPLGLCPEALKLAQLDALSNRRSVFLSLWSDDFDPHYSSKNNRGSVWLMTLTVQTAKSGNPNRFSVYPIATGNKDADHTRVVQILLDDINEMGNDIIMWNGAIMKNEEVGVHLLCVVQDQPERRKFNGLLTGGVGNHPRFGWNCNFQKLKDTMLPCKECRAHLATPSNEERWKPNFCMECSNWMSNTDILQMEVDDNNYPKEELSVGEFMTVW